MPPKVDTRKCTGCAGSAESCCERACPGDLMAVSPENGKAYCRATNECWDCMSCVNACPYGALETRSLSVRLLQGHTAADHGERQHHLEVPGYSRSGVRIQIRQPAPLARTRSRQRGRPSYAEGPRCFGGVMENLWYLPGSGFFCRVGRTAAAASYSAPSARRFPKTTSSSLKATQATPVFMSLPGLSVFSALQIRARNPSSFYAAPENCSASRKC